MRAIERVILRCLEADPGARPASALTVSAALPGGDPLAAALAAGETPSPEMVAAAGEGAGLSHRVAWLVLTTVLVGLAAMVAVTLRTSALDRMRPRYTDQVLAQKARDAIRQIGYTDVPRDAEYGFEWNDAFMTHVQQNDKPAPRWAEVLSQRPSPLQFWYRQSSEPLTAITFHTDLLTPGIVRPDDPPPITSGMIQLDLDHNGLLTFFEAIPVQRQEAPVRPAPVDWGPLVRARWTGYGAAPAGGTTLELAGRVRYARRVDGRMAREQSSAARGSRRARRSSGCVHARRTMANAMADAGACKRCHHRLLLAPDGHSGRGTRDRYRARPKQSARRAEETGGAQRVWRCA